MPEKKKDDRPLTYRIAAWYGFAFSSAFILYGGVSIILDILDRNTDNLGEQMLFVILGLVLISFAFAYRELKAWGYYGLVVVNCLIIIGAVVGYRHYENLVLLVLSVVALYALFSSTTKEYLFRRR
ncbi:MAG: hypothetical protein JSU74_11665 [Candidatus Zixiibacteriota bacterium]|nr:MAG: hypothetical protein JSU74_11665 [candidate division Zixibacteria bacterium]